MYYPNKNNSYHVIASAIMVMTIFTLAIIFPSSVITIPAQASTIDGNNTTTATTTTTSPFSGLELSPQPVWEEVATTTGVTPINETHSIATFIGNGTLTVPDTGETIPMTNNGTAIIAPLTQSGETISAYGKENVFSADGDTSAISFYEIVRYDPTTFEGRGLTIAVFDANATGSLAPFNGMMIAGTHEEDPTVRTATFRLWEWQGGIPFPTAMTATTPQEPSPLTNTTTTTNATTTADDTNGATPAAPLPEQGEGVEGEEQQQQTTIAPNPLFE
jgi:hypothetical protein